MLQLQWTPSYEYVNFIFNGEYYGVYMLIETVGRNRKSRLDVDDTGYIFEYDSYWWNENMYIESPLSSCPMHYTLKYPDTDELSKEQLSYVTETINSMEQSVTDGTYPDIIDVNSFATWILAEDLLGNRSGGGSNVFFTKFDNTKTSKVMMGNLWDFDRIFLMEDSWSGCRDVFLWSKLFQNNNKAFVDAYVSKWNSIKDHFFDDIISFLDDYKNTPEGRALDQSLLYEEYIWNDHNGTVSDNIEIAKSWFKRRRQWMASEISKMESTGIKHNRNIDDSCTDVIYDLSGRKLTSPSSKHGIYIYDKRIVVKK